MYTVCVSLARGILVFTMKKIKKLVVGNWKMNPQTLLEAKKLALAVKLSTRLLRKTQIVFCPPVIYMSPLSPVATNNFILGCQDAFYEASGSFTGEVSVTQLHQFKVGFVIVGHSERRKKGESDEVIAKKVKATVVQGLTAIVCVGEEVRDASGEYLHHIKNQIHAALKDTSKKYIEHLVIAYEPVWAVGGKEAMGSREVHEMAIFIRKVLRDLYGVASDNIRILYGGAVNPVNAPEIISSGFIQGLLVGRESLKPKSFVDIIKSVDALPL